MAALRNRLGMLGIVWLAAGLPSAAETPAGPADLVVAATIPRSVAHIAFGHGALWGLGDDRLVRVDAASGAVADIDLPAGPEAVSLMDSERYRGLAVGEGAVWVPDLAASAIYRVDPSRNAVTLSIPTDIFGSVGSIGVGEGSVWVLGFTDRNRVLLRYDAASGRALGRVALPAPGAGVLVALGAVWVSAEHDPELYRVDPATGAVSATIRLAGASAHLAATDDAIWIWHDVEGALERVDPRTGAVGATIATGTSDPESDGDIAAGGGFVWAINRAGIVARIDADAIAPAGTFRLAAGETPGRRIRYGAGALWMSGAEIRRITPPDR